MGGIIIEGRTGVLFKGPISNFEKVISGLKRIEKRGKGLKIDTVPLPEEGTTIVRMQFRGPMAEFENMLTALQELRSAVPIVTIRIPDSSAIKTWQTPEKRPRPATGSSLRNIARRRFS